MPGPLPQLLVRHTHDRDQRNRRMRQHDFFQLAGIHVESAAEFIMCFLSVISRPDPRPAPGVAGRPGLTVVKFDGIPAGGMIVMRVRSYANGDRQNLVSAVAADNRLKVLHRVQTTVGGEPATRLVVKPVPGITASDWFCPDSDKPCFEPRPDRADHALPVRPPGCPVPALRRRHQRLQAAKLQPIVDGAAATWHW